MKPHLKQLLRLGKGDKELEMDITFLIMFFPVFRLGIVEYLV